MSQIYQQGEGGSATHRAVGCREDKEEFASELGRLARGEDAALVGGLEGVEDDSYAVWVHIELDDRGWPALRPPRSERQGQGQSHVRTYCAIGCCHNIELYKIYKSGNAHRTHTHTQ